MCRLLTIFLIVCSLSLALTRGSSTPEQNVRSEWSRANIDDDTGKVSLTIKTDKDTADRIIRMLGEPNQSSPSQQANIGGGANVPVPAPIGGGTEVGKVGIGGGVNVPRPLTWFKCPESNIECSSNEVCVYDRLSVDRYTCRICKKAGMSHQCGDSQVICCENERCVYDRFDVDRYKCREL